MEAVKLHANGEIELKTPETPIAVVPDETERQTATETSKKSKKWLIRLDFLIVAAIIGSSIYWYYSRLTRVTLVQAIQTNITETITSKGRVGGIT